MWRSPRQYSEAALIHYIYIYIYINDLVKIENSANYIIYADVTRIFLTRRDANDLIKRGNLILS